MTTFRVGDWVRRRPECLTSHWPHGLQPVQVERIGVVPGSLHIKGRVWFSEFFELAQPPDSYHTDDDLAMALELANLCEWVDTPSRAFKIQSKVSRWLRAEVQRELRERGARCARPVDAAN